MKLDSNIFSQAVCDLYILKYAVEGMKVKKEDSIPKIVQSLREELRRLDKLELNVTAIKVAEAIETLKSFNRQLDNDRPLERRTLQ